MTTTSDDYQSPPEVIQPLLAHLKKEWTIWEPAAGKGNLVNAFHEIGFKVVASDIMTGEDFLTWEPEAWDCAVTNPPYSIKNEFLERAFHLGKPFAFLLPIDVLGTKKRQELFDKHELEIVCLGGRTKFEPPVGGAASPNFEVAWFTHGLQIGKQITFAERPTSTEQGVVIFDDSIINESNYPPSETGKYQPLGWMPLEQFQALARSIANEGRINLPIVEDEEGNTLDGHHRRLAIQQLLSAGHEIEEPRTIILSGLDEEGKRLHALQANLVRRQLSRKEKRAIIAAELKIQPDIADAWLAEICGVSDKTVKSVRKELVSKSEIPRLDCLRSRNDKPYKVASIAVDTPKEAKRARAILKESSVSEVEYYIQKLSEPGDLVCDPFSGSFTTAVACYRLDRRFIGCDLDEGYVKIGHHRLAEEEQRRRAALLSAEDLAQEQWFMEIEEAEEKRQNILRECIAELQQEIDSFKAQLESEISSGGMAPLEHALIMQALQQDFGGYDALRLAIECAEELDGAMRV